MCNKIMTPKMVEQMGLKSVCATCRPREIQFGKDKLKGMMCPQCGNHYDEFGNHNRFRAHKWIYSTFKQAGFPLNEKHVESLYMLARIKVSQNEATYMQVIEFALDQLKSGGKLPS